MAQITIQATIPFGSSLRVGYRLVASSDPFTYISDYLTSDDLPYDITSLASGLYEVELTTICPNCAGSTYSDPVIVEASSL